MKRANLKDMTVDELVEYFADLAIQQDRALLLDQIGTFNRLFDKMEDVKVELKSRSGDQREALLRLFQHSNAQVRLKAAKATLAIAPIAAREMLQTIADSKEFPQAGDAGMSLWNLDRGVFKPT
jgi:Domain of unknown function (DUF2019)